MKYIKGFNESNNKKIDVICKKYDIKNYRINDDNSVNVYGSVSLFDYGLEELPLEFNMVTGFFNCSNNKLTTLKNAPKHVTGNFICAHNKLESLEDAPEYIGGYFNCSNNKLKSLEHSPKEIGGSFYCNVNKLVDLKGCTDKINSDFNCSNNNIFTFKYMPHIEGSFIYEKNPIAFIYECYIENLSSIEHFNEFRIIDGNDLYLNRLNNYASMNNYTVLTSETAMSHLAMLGYNVK